MALTDKEINDKALDIEEGKDQEHCYLKDSDDVKEIFADGAKWARDHDPWHYVEDGDLPEAHENRNNNIVSKELLLRTIDCENDVGWFTQMGGKYYWETYSTHDIKGNGKENDLLDLNEVKCWQYITEPKR